MLVAARLGSSCARRLASANRKREKTSMQSFSELPISPYTQERLSSLNFSIPTPVQAAAIPQALAGKDVLATAQTGTGKTLAFLIPIIERLLQPAKADAGKSGIAALVLVPTRELAMQVVDQYNALRGTKLSPAALVVGGLAEGNQLTALRRGARIVVATPGRLEDFLDRRLISFQSLQVLVLDEADRMLDMGFLPALRRIAKVLPKDRQTLCFSATLEASVAHLVSDYTRNPVRLAFGSILKPSENVRVQAFEVDSDRKQEMLQRLLSKETGRCLVFARTKRGTERLARNLNREGFAAAMIHGDRSQSQRTAALTGFQQGRYRILIATDLASRGIHVQDIAHVINYDLPEVAENFIHRVGRTGRAGEQGVASTLFTREQRSELHQLERTLGIRIERMQADDIPLGKPARTRVHIDSAEALARGRMVRLPGETLQVQMGS
jgi:ATP-dependent RNA helicase RhlE